MNVLYDTIENFKLFLTNFLNQNDIRIERNKIKLCRNDEGADFSIYIPPNNLHNIEILLNEMRVAAIWPLPVMNIYVKGSIIFIHLEKLPMFVQTFKVLHRDVLNLPSKKVLNLCYDSNNSIEDLTNYRVTLLYTVIRKISQYLGYQVEECKPNEKMIVISNKSNLKNPLNCNQELVLCGCVLNSTEKVKETKLNVSDYLNHKKASLSEKIGKNIDNDNSTVLSEAMLKFELLKVKSSSPILLNINDDTACIGSVIFVLYNYSRLNAIIHEFETRVSSNYYPPLPAIDDVDLNLLNQKKEEMLINTYILQFPVVIVNSIKDLDSGKMSPHLLCQFLGSLAQLISSYYRSSKILLEPRSHLLNLMFARMYLVKALHWMLFKGLDLLTINVIPAL